MSPVVGTVLVIDDDPGIRGNNAELLVLSGHTCLAFKRQSAELLAVTRRSTAGPPPPSLRAPAPTGGR